MRQEAQAPQEDEEEEEEGPDNQTELYNYKDNELLDVLDHTTKLITYNIDTIICSATLFAGGVNNITNVNVKPPPKKPFDNLFA